MDEYVQVLTTIDKREAAERIAGELVERQLAGCVQVIGPIASVYRWQGQVEHAQEWLCLVKTRQALYEQVEEAIRSLHSYEVPEVLALPVVAGSAAYLNWLGEQLTSGEAS